MTEIAKTPLASLGRRLYLTALALLIATAFLAISRDVKAVTFTVNSDADNAGLCTATCTLRQAITEANTIVGSHTIAFAITGAGVHVITPATPLPPITRSSVTIDGYTQSGALANTSSMPQTSNATIQIQIDGSTAGSGADGLKVCAADVTIRGLSITNFDEAGVRLGDVRMASACANQADAAVITGNLIGLAADGALAGPNGYGVMVDSSANVQIGGVDHAFANIISANQFAGITAFNNGSAGLTVSGNIIGSDESAGLPRPNPIGVDLANNSGDTIGDAAAPNLFKANGTGIAVHAGASGHILLANDFEGNTGLPIDLIATGNSSPDGPTANDVDDTDSGGNGLQNFPAIEGVTLLYGKLSVSASLDRPAGALPAAYTIAVYTSASGCPIFGQGFPFYVGQNDIVILTNTTAAEEFTVTQDFSPPEGTLITMTATGTDGTSEFSDCLPTPKDDGVFRSNFETP